MEDRRKEKELEEKLRLAMIKSIISHGQKLAEN